MTRIMKKRLGEILLEDGLVTKEQLSEALSLQEKVKERKYLGELLIELGYLSEEGLCLTISKKLSIKYISFSDNSLNINFNQNLNKVISEKFARDNLILPLSKAKQYISVAMWDPLNFVVVDNVKRMVKMDLIIHCSTKKDIIEGIERLYSRKGVSDSEGGISSLGLSNTLEATTDNIDELKSKAAEAPVVKIVNLLIRQAVREKASDIHIEPMEDKISIRLRVDGVLYETEPPPKELIMPIISRIKILSRLDIAEKRLPQDGGFITKLDNRSIDFRVSSIPTIYGEKLAIRVLDKEQLQLNLASIGLSGEDLKKVSEYIKKPHGLIFLTGPTGSGKTTTLYCILNEIKSPKKNIITIEDPVEYRVEGVNQVQAMPHIGLDFARGLRTFLRQDPDVIMVGEVRDLETAEICVRSALVGRLVLSTLHTNDSVGSISRLIDFGVEPFLLASTLNMVIAQRLTRRLCPKCKQIVQLDKETIEKHNLKGVKVYGPKGCTSCRNRGFSGRIPVFEIMCMDRELQDMIEKRKDISVMRDALKKKGVKTLRDDGLDKVKQGLTSLDEALSITMDVI